MPAGTTAHIVHVTTVSPSRQKVCHDASEAHGVGLAAARVWHLPRAGLVLLAKQAWGAQGALCCVPQGSRSPASCI